MPNWGEVGCGRWAEGCVGAAGWGAELVTDVGLTRVGWPVRALGFDCTTLTGPELLTSGLFGIPADMGETGVLGGLLAIY